MRAIVVAKNGGPEMLKVVEMPEPEPGPGEVRIKVHAAGVNFVDVMVRQGLHPTSPKLPITLGQEAAGVVEKLGEGVTSLAIGQRVAVLTLFTGYAEKVCARADYAIEIPEGVSFEEAAALPLNYITAYHMLFGVARVRPGERVLIHMAGGGIGIAALQLCRTVENVVTFGTASAAKHDALRAEGCTYPIDYRNQDYAERARALNDGQGMDVILDPLGGRDWKRGMKLLRPSGHLLAYGFTNLIGGERRNILRMLRNLPTIPWFNPLQLMKRNHTISGIDVEALMDDPESIRPHFTALASLWQAGAIKPRVDSTYSFSDAAAAHRQLSERRNIGKVVLTP